MTDAAPNVDMQTVLDSSMGLSVRVSRIGTRKRVPNAVAADLGVTSGQQDDDLIHISKDIVDSPELKAIRSLDMELLGRNGWLTRRCLPSLFRAGIYLVPMSMIEAVDGRLDVWQIERPMLIDTFLDKYPQRVEEARARLGVLFDESDYPAVDDLRDKFGVKVQWLSLGVPRTLERISQRMFKREQERAQKVWAETTQTLRDLLCAEFAQLTQHLADRLSLDSDGKAKVIKQGALQAVQDWIDIFMDGRSVPNDQELRQHVDAARQVLSGLTAASLRDSHDLRVDVLQQMTKIREALDTQIIASSGRRVKWTELGD